MPEDCAAEQFRFKILKFNEFAVAAKVPFECDFLPGCSDVFEIDGSGEVLHGSGDGDVPREVRTRRDFGRKVKSGELCREGERRFVSRKIQRPGCLDNPFPGFFRKLCIADPEGVTGDGNTALKAVTFLCSGGSLQNQGPGNLLLVFRRREPGVKVQGIDTGRAFLKSHREARAQGGP